MTRRTATATGALVLLAAAFGTQGCREKLFSSAASKPSPDEACVDPSGSWIVVSPSQAFGPRVLILDFVADTVLRLAETPDSPAATAPHVRGVTAQPFQGITVSITERPSRAADGSWGTGLVPTTMSGTRGCSSLDFQGATVLSGAPAAFHLDLAADTVRGSVATGAGSTELFGLRVDPGQLVTMDSVGGATPVPDSTPVLMLRVDDVWAQDSLFLPKLLARGLTAELAVPTTYPGLPGRSPWADVIAEGEEGFGVAAHSRIHSEVTGPGFDFIVEVLGSMQDLKSRGLPTSVFVQPGELARRVPAERIAGVRGVRRRVGRPDRRVGKRACGRHPHDDFGIRFDLDPLPVPTSFRPWFVHHLHVPLEGRQSARPARLAAGLDRDRRRRWSTPAGEHRHQPRAHGTRPTGVGRGARASCTTQAFERDWTDVRVMRPSGEAPKPEAPCRW